MKLEKIHISKIKRNPNNPRLQRDDSFEKLKKSLKEFPQMQEIRPIVVDENYMILGGNMRYKALKDLGEKYVYIAFVDDLTEEQKKEFIVKDNLSYGEWDFNILNRDYKKTILQEWGMELPEKLKKTYEYGGSFDQEVIPYPITIVVTKDDYYQWQQIKKRLGINDDKKAFFELIGDLND